jgi:hypothetical protein
LFFVVFPIQFSVSAEPDGAKGCPYLVNCFVGPMCWVEKATRSSFIVVMGDCSSPGLGNVSAEEVAPSDCALVMIGFLDESVQGCIGVIVIGW